MGLWQEPRKGRGLARGHGQTLNSDKEALEAQRKPGGLLSVASVPASCRLHVPSPPVPPQPASSRVSGGLQLLGVGCYDPGPHGCMGVLCRPELGVDSRRGPEVQRREKHRFEHWVETSQTRPCEDGWLFILP